MDMRHRHAAEFERDPRRHPPRGVDQRNWASDPATHLVADPGSELVGGAKVSFWGYRFPIRYQ
jgi:hypothetical protein